MRLPRRRTLPQVEALEDRCTPSYAVLDLGAFTAGAINGAARVAGTVNLTGAVEPFPRGQPALWQDGTTVKLGTLGGSYGAAYDLNDAGQVAGTATTSSGAYQAFLWDSSTGMRNLGVAGYATAAYGINAPGQVVGTIGLNTYTPRSFLWDSAGGLRDLGTFGGTLNDGFVPSGSQARAINRSGQVVGWLEERSVGGLGVYYTDMEGYVWDSATATLTKVGTLPGFGVGQATGINDAGQVIGTSGYFTSLPHQNVYTPREAFLWQNGVMTDLGMPAASDINDLGQVVGGKFLWQGGTLTDLNTQIDPASGWVITAATGINDAGQIVGQATLNGLTHTVLLTPVDPGQGVSLTVTGFPATTTAGAAGSFTVTVTDGSGGPAAGYTGTVHFASSDPQAALPADYTFTAGDAGVHTFTATLKTAGSQWLAATDAAHGVGGTEAGITVRPAAAATLRVAGFPASVTAGVAGSFTVVARDAYGNTATGYAGTVHFSSSDPQAALPGDYTFTAADQGAHTFSATVKTAGNRWLGAADTTTATVAGSQAGILVSPAAASRLAVSGPASVSAGTAFSITVTAYDAYGNVATGYRGTVSLKSSDPSVKLPKSYTFTASDAGVHTFSGLVLSKKGTQTIKTTDTLDATLTASLTLNVL
jgi:probable HAF family extracellular repeat protein